MFKDLSAHCERDACERHACEGHACEKRDACERDASVSSGDDWLGNAYLNRTPYRIANQNKPKFFYKQTNLRSPYSYAGV